MISFSQLLLVCFFFLLLFGDLRKVYRKIILLFFNLKSFLKKTSKNQDKKNF